MMGHGSIRHNNREFTAANVDRERSGQNIVFVNEDLKQTYNNLFGEALEAYNARPGRQGRGRAGCGTGLRIAECLFPYPDL